MLAFFTQVALGQLALALGTQHAPPQHGHRGQHDGHAALLHQALCHR